MSLVGFFSFCMKGAMQCCQAGVPQSTRCGPNVLKLLTNNLRFDLQYAKYVDDTTIVSVSAENPR
jgi:hypothetical protein